MITIDGDLDLLIQNAALTTQREQVVNIGIHSGTIVYVGDAAADAARTVDAAGAFALPGLVDLHVHAYPGATPWGLDLEHLATRTGVTTMVDAGSAGAATFRGLHLRARGMQEARLLCFLNLSRIGLLMEFDELAHEELMDIELAAATIAAFRESIVGIKARLNADTVGALGELALDRALALAARTGLPLMVDIYDPPPSLEHILDRLRPGDILTHCCVPAGNSLAHSNARLEQARAAQARGIVLDIGHGMGSFSFRVAERMGEAGLWPDTISTDLHTGCVHGPVFDLPTTMSKLLCAGMPLADVLASVTSRPRAVLGEPAPASLAPGQAADVALLRLAEPCEFVDVQGERRSGPLLECLLTVRDGRISYQNPRLRYAIKQQYASKAARKVSA